MAQLHNAMGHDYLSNHIGSDLCAVKLILLTAASD